MKDSMISLMMEFNEKQEMLNRLSMDPRLNEYSVTELHMIQAIGKLEDPNVTKIAQYLRLSKGAVSKTVKKLVAYGVIGTYRLRDNRQKIYYCLNEKGEILFRLHENRDMVWKKRNEVFFDRLSDAELQHARDYLQKYVLFLEEAIARCDGAQEGFERERSVVE